MTDRQAFTTLIEELHKIPQEWQLTPLGKRDKDTGEINHKAPYLNDWQHKDVERRLIEQDIRSGKAIGIGLRLGKPSGYLVAIDFDGQSAIDLWTEKWGDVPPTISWTSGKEGRYQALFTIPEAYRERVKNNKISIGIVGSDGKQEALEFRYTGNQSVLPPSPHPETGGYTWINTHGFPMAELPQIVIDDWIERLEPKPRQKNEYKPHPSIPLTDIPSIPLENCLAKSNRELLDGVGEGGRNHAGATLARDLIGTANYLRGEGIPFEGDPLELFDRFSFGCTPPLSHGEADTIWKSAEKDNPAPSCKGEGVQNIIEAWNGKHKTKPVKGKRRKKVLSTPERDYDRLAKTLGINIEYDGYGEIASRLNKLEMDLFAMFGDRLKLNMMTRDYELDGQQLDINNAKRFIAAKTGHDHSTENCILAIHAIANRHLYHPVKEYIQSLKGKVAIDFSVLENIATHFLGNPDPLANKMMTKKLIAAVARVMKPGCKDDTLLVLQGGQGFKKSTFLNVLAGDDWFCDDIRDLDNKDELAKLSRNWILELAEVDYLMGRKEVESFKRFLSTTTDTYRPPYGRANIRIDRTCCFFATTNKTEFLADPTGDRRYWVVEVGGEIDCELVATYRDTIWASALAAYEHGDTWWLAASEEGMRANSHSKYREFDPWLEDLLRGGDLPTTPHGSGEYLKVIQIFDKLDIPITHRDRKNSNRVVKALMELGFVSKVIKINSKAEKVWYREKLPNNDGYPIMTVTQS